ncbi:MAG: hypothetical protein LBH59_03955 [Planctomycetaceae bacterium]|jgi:hypothetical protein|nr:hypothetical protein [Planctomycetaceae bacterium]
MKYLRIKNQITFFGAGFFVVICLLFFHSVNRIFAQDWQPGIDYSDAVNIEYEDSYNAPILPDEPVRMSERLIGQRRDRQNVYDSQVESSAVATQLPQRYRVGERNRVVYAAYDNSQVSNKIIPQNYESETNAKNIITPPRRLNSGKTSTSAMSAAVKPKALPKHISRDFNTNFNVDDALNDYSELPLDDSLIVRRSLQGNTIQASGISDCNDCVTGDETGDLSSLYADCGTCSEPVFEGYCSPMIMKPFGSGILDNLTIFGATTGFKAGELDSPFGDNFGFTEGLNWSAPISVQYLDLSTQLGFRAVHSNINGSWANTIGATAKNHRTQYFVTAGLFKRSFGSPLQAGVAFDHFEDNFYGKINLTQLRIELSVRTFSNLEYGFIGGFGLEGDSSTGINNRENYLRGTIAQNYRYEIKPQQYYSLFMRKYFAVGNLAEFRVGATQYGSAFMAASGEFPISDRVALNGSFSTMLPGGKSGWNRETWDLSVGIVIYFRGGAMTKTCNENRPMFDVAQNGSFLTRILRK